MSTVNHLFCKWIKALYILWRFLQAQRSFSTLMISHYASSHTMWTRFLYWRISFVGSQTLFTLYNSSLTSLCSPHAWIFIWIGGWNIYIVAGKTSWIWSTERFISNIRKYSCENPPTTRGSRRQEMQMSFSVTTVLFHKFMEYGDTPELQMMINKYNVIEWALNVTSERQYLIVCQKNCE